VKLQKIYHMGIPVDNLDRAKDFYTQVLGMEYLGRVGGNPNNPDSYPIHGVAQKLDRFRCGNDDVVLFERPKPIERDALDEDGIFHQAFDMAWEDYDDALKAAKNLGKFHRSVERDSGNTIYMFDSEGNYLELHFPRARRPARPAIELMGHRRTHSPRRRLGASAVNVLLFWLQLCRAAFSGKHPESSGNIH
jgi:catechol 2,3-dioxygenase-like lactoylglutathione lyase family enzyme